MWQFPHYGPESLTIIGYRIARHFCGGENFACSWLIQNCKLFNISHVPYLLDYTPPSNKRPPPPSLGAKLLRRVFIS